MKKKKSIPENSEKVPYFDAPDDKILAFDMFRGPSIGITSDIDLDNPGRKRNEDLNDQD
ncbi:hypothetical protein [Bacillus kexueae]|uniref:hypothetical protein n=1 Tax=Aeribacillus kexueae TaxID=2078952 RepID=UPI001FAF31D3|nr:hypothetical protein [Bacillus kexueae]